MTAIPCVLILLFGPGCLSSFKNYTGQRQGHEIAILRQQGLRFWLEDPADPNHHKSLKQPVDEMYLEAGDYVIWFVRPANRTGGAGSCTLEAGRFYGFRITGRQFLPLSKNYAFTGECFQDPSPDAGWDQRAY
ncbi:MAG: hypothetical protein NXI24_19470 [bacterium]|nr:hypothetical protein [bacterium]